MTLLFIAAILPRLFADQPPAAAPQIKAAGVTVIAVTAAVADAWKSEGVKVEVVDPAKLKKLDPPKVQMRQNVAAATNSPWIDANGWIIRRHPETEYFYDVTGAGAALAAAEAFMYGARAAIRTDAAGVRAFSEMVAFLKQIPDSDSAPMANIGIIDDGTDEMGEVMNMLSRRNLMYRVVKTPDRSLQLNVKLGSKEYPKDAADDPNELAHRLRYELKDERRLLRVYGSEVVIARLTGSGSRLRVHLLNYANRPVRGLRVRVLGAFPRSETRIAGVKDAKLADYAAERDATEFTVGELPTYAVIDLSK